MLTALLGSVEAEEGTGTMASNVDLNISQRDRLEAPCHSKLLLIPMASQSLLGRPVLPDLAEI